MGDSNGSWGELASHDNELAELWDTYSRLPEPGGDQALDAYCERKNIDISALVRLGAKLAEPHVLAFEFPGGVKFRDTVTGDKWSYTGSEWKALKIVKGRDDPDRCIVAEGESDAALLTMLYPEADVAVLPAGAKHFTLGYAEQLRHYRIVLVALDNDEAGDVGTQKILAALANAQEFRPTAADWCDSEEFPPLPDQLTRDVLPTLVPAGALLELEVPENPSWFEHDILPIGGLLVIHGWVKSFKSFTSIDMLAALAQGQDWCCFEPAEEACRVAVVQLEIPWAYYRERVQSLARHAREPKLFRENFMTYSPLARPQLTAGNTKQEDEMLMALTEADVQVVLIDPIRRATGGLDLNSEQDVGKILRFFERMNNEGITVVATHHDSKAGARGHGGDVAYMTGSGAFSGDPDTIVSISLPKGDTYQDSTRRNLDFTLRNAPSPSKRGLEMQKDGSIIYSNEPFGDWDKEDDDAPSI